MKIAIVGNGWVGQAMQELFPDAVTYVRDYNKALHKSSILTDFSYTDRKEIVNEADIAFVCVPTPLQDGGKLDTSIVEEVVAWLDVPLIVIRSTVNPGNCDAWMHKYKKRIVMQPEYLGETPNHPLLDETKTPFIVLGGMPDDRRVIINLYQTVYNANIKIRQVTNYEAEVIKLSENRAIAFKMMQCQELYDACEKAGIDYYTVRDTVYGDDPRFNLWWTFVYPEKRGFNNSKCLVKDVPAWHAWAESLGVDPVLTRTIIKRSNQYVDA